MSETNSEREEGLTVDRVVLPMKCWFVGCGDFWQREIRRRLDPTENVDPIVGPIEKVCFEEVPALPEPDLPGRVSGLTAGSTVVLEVSVDDIESNIERIHGLFQARIFVLVVGSPEIQAHSGLFHAAGASAVVTDIFGCDRLASVIQKAAAQQPEVLADWKTRFVNRMPWNAV